MCLSLFSWLRYIFWYENDGRSPPLFRRRVVSDMSGPVTSVVVADVDGDQDDDVVCIATSIHGFMLFENWAPTGAPASFDPGRSLGSQPMTSEETLVLGTVDNDTMPDVLFMGPIGPVWLRNTVCGPGKFGEGGAAPCLPCRAGYRGPWVGLGAETQDLCGGPCGPGQYSGPGSSACVPCAPGYSCPQEASTLPTEVLCAAGSFSLAGAAQCTPCPEGFWGALPGAINAQCSGPCPAGHACAVGAIRPTPCPVGTFRCVCVDSPPPFWDGLITS
jgi:hypothetical protein